MANLVCTEQESASVPMSVSSDAVRIVILIPLAAE
jgi:hypothetical protein